jgi:multiple sugar transport system permease protein
MLFTSLNAYALAKHKFRGSFFFYFMFVAGSMLPNQILMLPVFKMSNDFGLYNTHANLIIIHVAWHMAFATFVLRNFMISTPTEILESARLDGCSEFRIYWQMVLPLVLPGLAAIATLEFTWVFNDYLWSIILAQSEAIRPITAGLAQLRGTFQTNWPVIVAGAMIATIPTAIVFFGLQKYFIGGLTLGSEK